MRRPVIGPSRSCRRLCRKSQLCFARRKKASIIELDAAVSVCARIRFRTPSLTSSPTALSKFSVPPSTMTDCGASTGAPSAALAASKKALRSSPAPDLRPTTKQECGDCSCRSRSASRLYFHQGDGSRSCRRAIVHPARSRMPSFGATGWTLFRGRRHPRSRTYRHHVAGAADTRPSRWAKMASIEVKTWRYSGAVVISRSTFTPSGVSDMGLDFGQLSSSSRVHSEVRFQTQ